MAWTSEFLKFPGDSNWRTPVPSLRTIELEHQMVKQAHEQLQIMMKMKKVYEGLPMPGWGVWFWFCRRWRENGCGGAYKLILLFSSYEMVIFGNKTQSALYFLCVWEELFSRELVCIKCLSWTLRKTVLSWYLGTEYSYYFLQRCIRHLSCACGWKIPICTSHKFWAMTSSRRQDYRQIGSRDYTST